MQPKRTAGASSLYERSVLILDQPNSGLGEHALGLIAMGISPYYANNLDDAIFLAGEHRQRIAAFAAPTAVMLEQLELVRKELLAQIGLPLACAVPVGGQPSDEERSRLAATGVRWSAFDSLSARELRCVLSLALSQADRKEARREPRVPVSLPVEVTTNERTFRAELMDLSAGGAYIASRSPLKQGTPLMLAFSADEKLVSAKAEVRWRTSLDGGFAGWLEAGMGVELVDVAYEARSAIRRHVAAILKRFEVAPAKSG
jgi:uncharacterized protein (TIGR02266 family)